MRIGAKEQFQADGFSRPDAITLAGTLFLLGVLVWLGIVAAGEKRRTLVCAHRMKVLGRAFADHAKDYKDTLPPAVFEDGTNNTSWDREIAVYLQVGARSTASVALPETNRMRWNASLPTEVAPAFKCPSDKEPRGGVTPRSYSMPMYDINTAGWPPDENCAGGVGLYLDGKRLEKTRKALPGATSDYLPAIKLAMVTAPADTALLVERISIQNALWATKFACIVSIKEQFDAKTFDAKDFHGGRLNYLLLDGHVELLVPAQSAGFTGGVGGLWTISPTD